MKQGLLAFQYEEEKSTTGMTALSGLMTYVDPYSPFGSNK